ncbi:hypothetical protein SAMN04488113_102171 [Alkalibacterium gilvum]|uniref:Uncharacterized protein n=1 Tax=Alkalibacterium gilvum TaxID=1130080 RepID=A0A1H6RRA9_9LACT|nr:hypothetical protein [Alkalibacterium gilvum]SEI54085.1 hypothetical protein SAMN04488113_102171 [Alkalibacterium gilvum]
MTKLLLEIKDFFKSNMKFIILGTLITGLLYTTFTVFRNSGNGTNNSETQDENIEELYSDGAYFNFYVENEDGSAFNNTSILEQFLLMEDTLESISNNTNIDILSMFQEERRSSFERTPENRGVLGLTRNTYSNRLSLIVQTPKQSDNLTIANYIYDMIRNDEIPILADKEVYFFETPRKLDSVLVSEEVMEVEKTENSLINILISAITSLLFGFVIFSGIAFLRALFSNQLNYSFAYFREEDDQFEILDRRVNNFDEVKHMVSIPEVEERIILSELGSESVIKNNEILPLNNNAIKVRYLNDLVDVKLQSSAAEVLVIVVTSKTTRKWYRKQRKFLKAYNLPVKVLQVNEAL